MLRGASEDQVGPYEVRIDDADNIGITQTAFDEWNQMDLPIQEDESLLNEDYGLPLKMEGQG
jgi:hypothetical protein